MKRAISLLVLIAVIVTVSLSSVTAPAASTLIPDQAAASIEGAGWLSGCGIGGMWGVGAILLSAGPVGWFALGVAASFVAACYFM